MVHSQAWLYSGTSPAQLTRTTTDSSATPSDPTRHRSKREVPAAAARRPQMPPQLSYAISMERGTALSG